MGAVVSDHVTPSPAIPHLLYEREVEQLTPHTDHYAHDNPITLSKGSLVLLDFPGSSPSSASGDASATSGAPEISGS
jgi:hypothetical protein